MTSRRRLKKEIDYMLSDLILDSFIVRSMGKKVAEEESVKIVQDTLILRNKLRDQANHPEKKGESVSAKSYYSNIAKTLIEGIESGYGRLGKLIDSKEK